MIEFDVDMGYLLEEGELDRVILNDENGEHDPMEFRPSSGECVMNRVKMFPEHKDCIFECWECSACKRTNDEHRPRFCPNCGKRIRKKVGE